MEEKLHVLHVVGAMDIGGIENMLMTLMPHMREKGIIFDFAVHGDAIGVYELKIKEFGGRIYHLPKFVGINIFSYLRAWRKILTIHPELKIIHGHMTSTASIYLWLAKRYHRVAIAHSHSTSINGGRIIYGIKRLLEYPLRYISDYLCACSDDAANYRFGQGTSKRDNYFLWHNAIDTKKFRFSQKKRDTIREKFRCDENTVVIGHVGRMIKAKNHDLLLDVFEAFRHFKIKSKLLLVGDGPMRLYIEKKAKEIDIFTDIIFIGAVTNPADYLSAIDVFCYPSLYEGLSVSLIEAQINGRKCLCSDVIPHEAFISSDLRVMSISQPASVWAKCIERMSESSAVVKVTNNPYDVKAASKEINEFYKNIIQRTD